MNIKKITGIFLIILAIISIFFPDKSLAVNLLQNGDFELGTINPWETSGGGATATISSEISYEGDYSLLVNNDKTGSYGYQQTIQNIGSGKYYLVSGYGLTSSNNTLAYFLRIAWYESNDGSGSQILPTIDSNKGEQINEWKKHETRVQAPENAHSVKIRTVLNSKAEETFASVYFDNLLVEETLAPTSKPTPTNEPSPTDTPTPTLVPTPIPTSTPTPTKKPTPTLTSDPTSEPTPPEEVLMVTKALSTPTTKEELGEVLGLKSEDRNLKLPIIFISLGLILILVSLGTLLLPKLKGYNKTNGSKITEIS